MPRGDRTGPEGMGPMTGRRMGYCVGGDPQTNFSRGGRALARGFRGGYGRGFRGFGFWQNNYPANGPFQDKNAIVDEISALKEQVSLLEKKLKDLD